MVRVVAPALLAVVAACGSTATRSPRQAPDPMTVCQQAMAKVAGATAIGVAAALPGGNEVECGFRIASSDHLDLYRVGTDGVPHPSPSTTG